MADELPFSKISISGPTLSSLLHHSLSSPSPLSGLLFGHLTSLPSPDPTDSDPTPSSSSSLLSLTITSFISSPLPFFDSLGRLLNPNPNPNPNGPSSLIGWFSSRPLSPLRPSMRELAASSHLSEALPLLKPHRSCAFLLLSSHSTANHAVHTHEYRAFVLLRSSLRPISLDVVNVGPKFRGQYGAFSPESSLGFPLFPCRARDEGCERRTENGEGRAGASGVWEVEGFAVERLEGLVGERAEQYTKELEDLYAKTMVKLETLVRMVEESSAKVQEQESRNSVLRNKLAGFD